MKELVRDCRRGTRPHLSHDFRHLALARRPSCLIWKYLNWELGACCSEDQTEPGLDHNRETWPVNKQSDQLSSGIQAFKHSSRWCPGSMVLDLTTFIGRQSGTMDEVSSQPARQLVLGTRSGLAKTFVYLMT